jgi:hypothetical protein
VYSRLGRGPEAREILQKGVVLKEMDGKSDEALDGDVVRFGMGLGLVEHFSIG